jgi:hypothetical protein
MHRLYSLAFGAWSIVSLGACAADQSAPSGDAGFPYYPPFGGAGGFTGNGSGGAIVGSGGFTGNGSGGAIVGSGGIGTTGGTAGTGGAAVGGGGGQSGGGGASGAAGASGGRDSGGLYPSPEPCPDPAKKKCGTPTCVIPSPANGCSLVTCVECPSVDNGIQTCAGNRCAFECNSGFRKTNTACVPDSSPAADGGDAGPVPTGSPDGSACTSGLTCRSGVCTSGTCRAARCDDGVTNGRETDKDCGGNCGPCPTSEKCKVDADCSDGPCNAGLCACAPYTCFNPSVAGKCGAVPDNCGGTITPACGCGSGQTCYQGACCDPQAVCKTACGSVNDGCGGNIDCGTSVCTGNTTCFQGKCCTPAGKCPANACGTADDGCGQKIPCAACTPPLTCGFTTPGQCGSMCTDTKMNGAETDVDCGGGTCAKCADQKKCKASSDCTSGVCASQSCGLFCNEDRCQAPTCSDGVKNGTETDVDCAGSCSTKCRPTQSCGGNADCASGSCTSGKCDAPAHCSNSTKDADESDVDCGGSCVPCAATKICANNTDCQSGQCRNRRCQ